MAALHSALKGLAPVNFSDIPQEPNELDSYLAELYAQAQTVVESIPLPDPDSSDTRQRANTVSSIASNASEISASSARSSPPDPQYQALQKEWGKPLKLNKNEIQLGISVYKLGGKDGRGAWFARRSVHEGLAFSRFKKAFEAEFPTSLAVQGAPGEGNIRGIGAEKRVVTMDLPHRGKVEVYRLSAQFPGPTTPRDFVTLLATSSKALKHEGGAGRVPELGPRHYMIISKPCNHPETQPRPGFIRGQYESVEFIRDIPRKLKTSHSSTNLHDISHRHGHNLEQDLLIRNAQRHPHDEGDKHHLRANTTGPTSRDASPSGRKRSQTVSVPQSPSRSHGEGDDYDPEENPVEWIMVTRSDPGGSVPRFLVERGTPGSICTDAVKFLDWACGLQGNDSLETPMQHPQPFRRESFTSWQESENQEEKQKTEAISKISSARKGTTSPMSTNSEPATHSPTSPDYQTPMNPTDRPTPPSIISSAVGIISSYTPQAVLDHIPRALVAQTDTQDPFPPTLAVPDDDAASTISSTSFASADSHLGSLTPESNSILSQSHSLQDTSSTSTPNQHEKELAKLTQRRQTLEQKFAATKSKLVTQQSTASDKEALTLQKAEERHKRDLKKHQEKYDRELKRLEERKVKEAKKLEQRKRKQEDKDEKARLTRERDEAREKLKVMEEEKALWMRQIGELQKENTTLTQRIGKLEGGDGGRPRGATFVGVGVESVAGQRSRSSSMMGKKKPLERTGTGLGSEMSGHSGLKSESSSQTGGS